MMSTDSISVVVVNWNGLSYLQTCLPALFAQRDVTFEVIVVDNGSDDGSVAWMRAHYPQIRLLTNSDNRGFAEANNQGMNVARGDYIVMLNNDTIPDPSWLWELLSAAELGERVGMVASQIAFADRPEILDSAGIEVDVLGIAWNRHLGCNVVDEPETYLEVFGPSGAAALYRRSMLSDLGGLDARYFMYYEDVDLAWRARRQGWHCLYAPKARVLHVHSASGGKIPGFKAYYLGLNKWRTLFKHYPFQRLWLWVPFLFFLDGLAWGGQWIVNRDRSALRGRLKAWRERAVYLRERDLYGDVAKIVPWLRLPNLKALLTSLSR